MRQKIEKELQKPSEQRNEVLIDFWKESIRETELIIITERSRQESLSAQVASLRNDLLKELAKPQKEQNHLIIDLLKSEMIRLSPVGSSFNLPGNWSTLGVSLDQIL